MIYQCNFKTPDFSVTCFLTFRFSLPKRHRKSHYLSETANVVSPRKFDVKMMYMSVLFDFPLRITCSSYQICRQHPWIRKTILQNRVISINSDSYHCQTVFRDMYHIIFLFGKICFSILALMSVCTG